jgi:hypothetical protein
VTDARNLYRSREDVYGAAWQTIDPRRLEGTALWSDQVRESRNVVHFENQPPMPNSYEQVAALLMGAVTNIRTLHAATAAVHDLY